MNSSNYLTCKSLNFYHDKILMDSLVTGPSSKHFIKLTLYNVWKLHRYNGMHVLLWRKIIFCHFIGVISKDKQIQIFIAYPCFVAVFLFPVLWNIELLLPVMTPTFLHPQPHSPTPTHIPPPLGLFSLSILSEYETWVKNFSFSSILSEYEPSLKIMSFCSHSIH